MRQIGTIYRYICTCVLLATFGTVMYSQAPVSIPSPGPKEDQKTVNVSARVQPLPNAQDPNSKQARVEAESEEEAAILPYYNNYLREYHLGPEDVISVEVFSQPNYSKTGIVIPPTAKISYPLIPGGVFVGGKTVDQVAAEIKQKLDEYIIDPQVTVTIEKVGSARYSVLGKVENPGVKVMNRRYNLYEAIAEAGGISKEGDKNRVLLIRMDPVNGFSQRVVDMEKVLKGQAEIPYLSPGDQIVIPEKRWSLSKIVGILGKASAFRILFGSPF